MRQLDFPNASNAFQKIATIQRRFYQTSVAVPPFLERSNHADLHFVSGIGPLTHAQVAFRLRRRKSLKEKGAVGDPLFPGPNFQIALGTDPESM